MQKGDILFGYIRPHKPELKIKDYETYRSVYCGLCKELGRLFGPFARMTLNYDFTFLALLQLGLTDAPTCSSRQRCMMHPFNKRLCCHSNESLRLTACAAMLMVFYKNRDNFDDGGIWEKGVSLLLHPFLLCAKRRADKLYPELNNVLKNLMNHQKLLERQGCQSVDEAANPTANALSSICEMLSDDERQRRVLSRFGYLLGRWIYLIDALDDLDDDLKHKRYNPFIYSLKDEPIETIKSEAACSLRLTHGEMTKTVQLLTLYNHTDILENIVFLGLPTALARITSDSDSTKDEEQQ